MKKILFAFMALFVACATFTSCSNDDEPNNPNTPVTPPAASKTEEIFKDGAVSEFYLSEKHEDRNGNVIANNYVITYIFTNSKGFEMQKALQNGEDATAYFATISSIKRNGNAFNFIFYGATIKFDIEKKTYAMIGLKSGFDAYKVNGVDVMPEFKNITDEDGSIVAEDALLNGATTLFIIKTGEDKRTFAFMKTVDGIKLTKATLNDKQLTPQGVTAAATGDASFEANIPNVCKFIYDGAAKKVTVVPVAEYANSTTVEDIIIEDVDFTKQIAVEIDKSNLNLN